MLPPTAIPIPSLFCITTAAKNKNLKKEKKKKKKNECRMYIHAPDASVTDSQAESYATAFVCTPGIRFFGVYEYGVPLARPNEKRHLSDCVHVFLPSRFYAFNCLWCTTHTNLLYWFLRKRCCNCFIPRGRFFAPSIPCCILRSGLFRPLCFQSFVFGVVCVFFFCFFVFFVFVFFKFCNCSAFVLDVRISVHIRFLFGIRLPTYWIGLDWTGLDGAGWDGTERDLTERDGA